MVEEANELDTGNQSIGLQTADNSRKERIKMQLGPTKSIKKQKDPIVECMQDVAQSMVKISSSLAPQFTESDIQKLVRDEVEKATMETKKSIDELKEFIGSMFKN